MRGFRLTPRAIQDLEDIWLYTAETWSRQQADRYYHDIVDAMDRLASGLSKGRPSSIREGYFKYLSGRHMIFFKPGTAGIVVIRILHQSMDAERHL